MKRNPKTCLHPNAIAAMKNPMDYRKAVAKSVSKSIAARRAGKR